MSQLPADASTPVVLIDQDGIVRVDEIEAVFGPAEVQVVNDWFELRRAWERSGRHRSGREPLVLVTRDGNVAAPSDLPFDIEQGATAKRIRVPGPLDVRQAMLALEDDVSDLAVSRLAGNSLTPSDAVLTAAAGLPPIRVNASPIIEFQLALRLASHPHPPEVMALARSLVTDVMASAVVDQPPRLDLVQEAWTAWVADPDGSAWARHMQECRAEIIDLFMAGMLEPVDTAHDSIPLWATIGVGGTSPAARVDALLDAPPASATSFEDWARVAQWWGEVRSGLAQINPVDDALDTLAWDWWRKADAEFLRWLLTSYGPQLSRAWTTWPASLDKVQPFLSHRRPDGGRLLLVVLDGMGFTQWTRIRELASIRVAQSGGVLAMVPTLTEVSRQAIAAGTLPIHFANSLRTTSWEPKRWADAWQNGGATTTWLRVDGTTIAEVAMVPLGDVDIIGLVVSATDELMHTAELLGDIGLHVGIEAWLRSGFLTALISKAAEHNYDIWLTADHGNLSVEPRPGPREGDFVERAGKRARRYASKTLRDNAVAEGVTWDTIPGYPQEESERLLFAAGRVGWGASRVSHGGLSLDEVIVPLVQIEGVA